MKCMLDTDSCIYIIRRKSHTIRERVEACAIGDIGISTMTLAELEYGAEKSSQPKRNREALEQFMEALEIAPFDRQATLQYGQIRVHLEKIGQRIGGMDLLIAAHARSLGVTLITNNEREFKRVPGLRVENWM
jgi:tRNA(fMet)-specific endonuclease VapC